MLLDFPGWTRRLRRVIRRREFERMLDDELRHHLDAEAAELQRQGVSPAEARRRAVALMGGTERWREEARDTRLSNRFETMMRDARITLRSLARSRAYTIPLIATLTLGIGATATIATVAYDIVFRPLPYRDPSRLVAVYERNVPRNRDRNVVSVSVVRAWRERGRSFSSVAALMPATRGWITASGAERVAGAEVSPELFTLLGRVPALGAGFTSRSTVSEVILSHHFWRQKLGSDSLVIGRSIRLGGEPLTVVGVMPPDFEPPRFGWMGEQEFWTPFLISPQFEGWGRFLLVMARLSNGTTIDAANREVHDIHTQLRADGVVTADWDAHVVPLTGEITGSVRGPVVALLVACGLLVLMVLTNAALLTIARSRQRAGDRVLRRVLGATHGRLIAERVISALLLALGGAAMAIVASMWAIPALTRLFPTDVPRLSTVSFGVVTSIVAVALAICASVTLAIASGASRDESDLSSRLQGARLTRGSRTAAIVIGESAAAVVLTLFAVLTLRSFDRLARVDLGFDTDRLLAFRVGFETPGRSRQAAAAASRDFLASLRTLPGVLSVGRTSVRPLYQGGTATTVAPLGAGARDPGTLPVTDVRFVDRGYFTTLGLTPLSGRLFDESDRGDSLTRVVVNESLARTLWPGESDVIGRSIDVRVNGTPTPEIIGVVRDIRLASPRVAPRPTTYVFTGQQSFDEEYDVVLRTAVADEFIVLPQVREALKSVSVTIPIFRVQSVAQTARASIARERVTAQLLTFFAAAALLLVAVGVYGLYAGEVVARRVEIGVRMALGETGGNVIRTLLARAMARAVVGVGAGAALGIMASRALETTLYGVPRTDPLSYAGAMGLVIVTATLATLPAAMRAAGVMPSEALRAE